MKKRSIVFIVFLLGLFLACDAFAGDTYGGQSAQEQQAGKSSDEEIIFYGKVIDQYGQPVAGAQITAGREYFSTGSVRFFGAETVTVEADENGLFMLTGLLVKRLYIRSIEKRCYEAPPAVYESSYSFDADGKDPVHAPERDNPVVFILKKTCDPGLVDCKKTRMLVRPSCEGFTVDLFKGFSDPQSNLAKEDAAADVKVFIDQVPGENSYHMLVSAAGKNNGVTEKKDAGNIAPASGYVPAYVYAISSGQEGKAILYHKGRGGTVYSRLEISLAPGSNGVMISADLYTNIGGGRNTDFDSIHTEEEVCRLTGKRFSYGGPAYRQAVADILQQTIR